LGFAGLVWRRVFSACEEFVGLCLRAPVVRVSAAYARPTAPRSRNAGGAIPRIDFRPRVRVAARHTGRF
jgi:hypothetical protein